MDFNAIQKEALELSPTERTRLIKNLLVSLETETDENLQTAWIEEIQRRVEEIDRGEVELFDAEDVFREARNLSK